MIKFIGKLPERCYVAVSGGADSMAVLDFLSKKKTRKVKVLHFNHNTEFGHKAENLVKEFCFDRGIPFYSGRIEREKYIGESPEEFWRNERYRFFSEFGSESEPIILAHTLDDQIENWIFTSLHGNPYLIPYKRDKFLRPFILTERIVLRDWCKRKLVPFLDDPANEDRRYMRSIIRHDILPVAKRVNAGIEKTIRKKILEEFG